MLPSKVGSVGRFDDFERELLGSADRQLPALSVARSAAEALETALEGASVEPPSEDPPPSYFARSALLLLAIIGLRTARSCLLVISAGYEPEAHGLKRRLSEAHARAQAVAADPSGQHARDWLEGKGPSTPRSIAGKWGSLETWDMYSASGHADARAVRWWLMVPMEDSEGDQRGLVVQPHRRPRLSNAMLTEVAMECRDLAHALAFSRGGQLAGIQQLDAHIDQAITAYMVAPPGR